MNTSEAPPRRVLGVVGSLRRESFNRRLLAEAVAMAPERLRIDVVDRIVELPLFDEDLEVDGFPPAVAAVHESIAAADGVVIASPEYNFGVPGPLKNFVDWASRPPRRRGRGRRTRPARSRRRPRSRRSCAPHASGGGP